MTIEKLLRTGKRRVLAGVAAMLIGAAAVPSSMKPTMAANGPASADLAGGVLGNFLRFYKN